MLTFTLIKINVTQKKKRMDKTSPSVPGDADANVNEENSAVVRLGLII